MADTDPLIEHNDYDDDDDEGVTNPFQSSTPGPSGEDIPLTTMNRERERNAAATTAETSFIEGDAAVSRVLASNERAWEALTGIFPAAKDTELEASHNKRGRLQVKMFGQGKKIYNLYTEERKTGEQRLNLNLPKEIKNALGRERDVLIAEKDKEIEELDKSIQRDEEILRDENVTSVELRERVRERINENTQRRDDITHEREELEERLSLRERVKNIFKKYGFTVTAVVLAVGTIIGVIINSLTKGLKSVATGVGNGLKTRGKKKAQFLPGLIGTIVGFIFKTAGSVISFLGKNAWLLILGVTVFMVERFQKGNK